MKRFVIDSNDRILLLQGPIGPFFREFGRWLRDRGIPVWKINLNGGDWLFYRGPDAVSYRDRLEEWPRFLDGFLRSRQITRVFLFGDCRLYHRLAISVCERLGVKVMVFEEGYIRPDYVTLEEGGVNAHSLLPRDPSFYFSLPKSPEKSREPARTAFRRLAISAVLYYLAGVILSFRFRNYAHHKSFNALQHGFCWARSGLRKILYKRRDRHLTDRLRSELSKKYFFVPLQVYCDTQILFHSDYADIKAFIREVLESFARHAPRNTCLVFKHHPMDRGYRHYGKFIDELTERYRLKKRVIYAHELHLPTCLDHARGVVVVNSTVGLSALWHGVPLKALGRALYAMPGLTSQKPLHRFWKNPGSFSEELHAKFRAYLIDKTQLNGSFYGLFPFAIAPRPLVRRAGPAVKRSLAQGRRGSPFPAEGFAPVHVRMRAREKRSNQ